MELRTYCKKIKTLLAKLSVKCECIKGPTNFPAQKSNYQDMKGKKEDDNGKSKSIRESMHANQFADLLVHVELEQRTNCSRSQSMPVKETGPNISARPAETESP